MSAAQRDKGAARTCAKCGREGSRGFRVNRFGATVCTQGGVCLRRQRNPRRAGELGVTDADYFARLAAQGGVCAIKGCNTGPSERRRLDSDHDHCTKQVRGLLCHVHNRRLWRGATPAELRALADYLERAAQAVAA